MATEEGARIFRTPGLGTLVPGAPADMIALNLDEPNLCQIFNETSHAVFASSGAETNVLESGENDGKNEKNHGFCLQKPGKWYLQSAEKSCILNVAVGNYGAFTHDCGAKAHKVEGHSLKWGSCPQR